MKINGNYINEYKKIIQTTNLQLCYQEFIKFFRHLRVYLEEEMKEYMFTGNIVENNMDYAYFQFTSNELKKKGLKIVIAFVHNDFNYEVWLSGVNRSIQNKYYEQLKNKKIDYILTTDPNHIDYIIKNKIINDCDYDNLDKLLIEMKGNIIKFIDNISKVI